MVVVYSGDFIVAGQIKGLLENAKISAFLQDEVMSTMHPVVGRARVMVAQSHLKKAQAIIQDFLTRHAEGADDESSNAFRQPFKTILLPLGSLVLVMVLVTIVLSGRWVDQNRAYKQYAYRRDLHRLQAASTVKEAVHLYHERKYTEATKLFQHVVNDAEQHGEAGGDPYVQALEWLANLQQIQGHDAEAEPLYQHLLQIKEQRLGTTSPALISTLFSLGSSYAVHGRYEEANSCYQRVIQIMTKAAGPEHVDVLQARIALRGLYVLMGAYPEAEQQAKELLSALGRQRGPDHPSVADAVSHLAYIEELLGHYEEAEALYQRLLASREKNLGSESPAVAATLIDYAVLLRKAGKLEQAAAFEERAKTIYQHQNSCDTRQNKEETPATTPRT